jgi:hypothetical protein
MPGEFCPRCGTARTGAFRFCRGCGLDLEVPVTDATAALPVAPAPSAPAPGPAPQVQQQPSVAPQTPTFRAQPTWVAPKKGPGLLKRLTGLFVLVVLAGVIWNQISGAGSTPAAAPTAPPVVTPAVSPTPVSSEALTNIIQDLGSNGTDWGVAQPAFQALGFYLDSSPLSDGTPRLLGKDASSLVIMELIGDPITGASVSAPIPGSGVNSETLTGTALGAEAAIFGNPGGMSGWVISEMSSLGAVDKTVSKSFGRLKVTIQWEAQTLGIFTLTYKAG